MPVTASTATIRAWARAEGLDVAERGRLNPQIVAAFTAANGSAGQSTRNRKPSNATPAKPASRVATTKAPVRKAQSKSPAKAAPFAAARTDGDAIAAVREDTRIADLQAAVTALTARVAKLEAASATSEPRKRRLRRA